MIDVQHVAVAIKLSDGGVSIMRFVTYGRGGILPQGAQWFGPPSYWTREPTEETLAFEINKTFDGNPVRPVSWRVIPDESVPQDRTYRAAWIDDGKAIVHDMEKARELHKDKLRFERKQQFEELDAQWMKAMGAKDEAAADAVEAQRQVLRDVTADPRIATAKTTDELKLLELPSEETLTAVAVAVRV